MMDLFARTAVVAALEASLETCSGRDYLDALVALSWHLRQRDCKRALALADEAMPLMAGMDETESAGMAGRLLLVRAEAAWLFADLDRAESLATDAMAGFERIGDMIGVGDSLSLLAWLWTERGNRARFNDCMETAVERYRVAGDHLRFDLARIRLVFFESFTDLEKCKTALKPFMESSEKHDDSLEPWILNTRAGVARLTGDPGLGVKFSLQAFPAFRESGQVRNAIAAIVNASISLSDMGDLDSSLEWNERALDIARGAGWPGLIGICLMQTGKLYRLLGRYEASGALLKEALDVMVAFKYSRNYSLALRHLGDLAIDSKDYPGALDWFSRLEERAAALKQTDLLMPARRGRAISLSWLGRTDEALRAVDSAISLARDQGHADEHVQALRVRAQIFRQNDLPSPKGMTAPNASLHFLNEALQVAEGIEGYSVPADLLDEAGAAYADSGDYQKAYEYGQSSSVERTRSRARDAQNRMMAMQVKHETERIQAEAGHQRQLALAESARAETLQRIGVTLETLGQIGRELTASLDTQAVFTSLHQHVHELLDVTTFFIYLLDPARMCLVGAFAVEDGKPFSLPDIGIDEDDSQCARCVRERHEIVMDEVPEKESLIPGTLSTQSLLYAPLMVGDRISGVMSIQSVHAHAYAERECSIFRTLCAYGATTLDNARAYADLAEATEQIRRNQQQLLVSEKMASLGRLTAGIAHGMNTPLATVRASIDELIRLAREYDDGVDNQEVNREDHHGIASDMKKALGLAVKGSERAASFIRGIKNRTRESKAADAAEFDLVVVVNETLTLLDYLLRPKAVKVKLSGTSSGHLMHGLANQFSHAIGNLLSLAIDAVPEKDGVIELAFASADGFVTLTVRDNGSGMKERTQSRDSDPVFTVARDIVTGDLKGTMECTGEEGKWAAVSLRFSSERAEP